MRRSYEEIWDTNGALLDAIALMSKRIGALAPRKPRFMECEVTAFRERHDGTQDTWIVTLCYEAEDES